MPTYDYHCETCGQDFEYFQSMTSPKLTICPEDLCRSSSATKGKGSVVRKVSGGAGLVFNGGGFYSTDYVSKGSNANGNAVSKGGDDSTTPSSGSENASTNSEKKSSPNLAGDSTSGTSSAS